LTKKGQAQQTASSVSVMADQQALLNAFVGLIGERWGYFLGRRLKQQEMAEKTKAESKAVRELAKTERKHVEEYIEKPASEIKTAILSARKGLKSARETLKQARKPFMEKITPLAKAVRYCDNVAIPDSLKELGHPVQPRFSLSDWATEAIKPKKKE
jgi:hypothetical protein